MTIRIDVSILLCCLSLIHSQAIADTNIYANTQAGMFSPVINQALSRVYVPSNTGTISVIDPASYQVIDVFNTGKEPQHVVPSYDLQTLWVLNNKSNTVTPIDPNTAKPGTNIPVDDPYNLYFTPNGKYAIVVCEARKQLQFRDSKTMQLMFTLPISCKGANHMEFTVDGRNAIVTCEFSGELMKIDLIKPEVIGYLSLNETNAEIKYLAPVNVPSLNINRLPSQNMLLSKPAEKMKSMPQDIRSQADGKIFFVADMMRDGLVLIDPMKFIEIGFIPTGIGTHAIYPNRDGTLFYVSNRGCHRISCPAHGPGSISVVDPAKRAVVATWLIPNGGSPDMGNISGDGRELWLSGRYDSEVYVFDTTTGNLTHRIPVEKGPHGLAVWPQPGRYSLGHTGNMR